MLGHTIKTNNCLAAKLCILAVNSKTETLRKRLSRRHKILKGQPISTKFRYKSRDGLTPKEKKIIQLENPIRRPAFGPIRSV